MLNLIPLPYRILIGAVLLSAIFGYGYYLGHTSSEKAHQIAILQAEQARLGAEKKAAEITTKVVETVVYKDKIITKQGAKVTEYIDRWHEAIDAGCTLSPEAVSTLNQAAEEPK